MDIPALFGGKGEDQTAATAAAASSDDVKNDDAAAATPQPMGVIGDPLATPSAAPAEVASGDDNANSGDDSAVLANGSTDANGNDDNSALVDDNGNIIPNKTITTDDNDTVGELATNPTPAPAAPASTEPDLIAQFAPKSVETPAPTPDADADTPDASSVDVTSQFTPPTPPVVDAPTDAPAVATPTISSFAPPAIAPALDDPEKITFIKTYTKEFDDALHRATTAAQKVLDAIDSAIRERAADIAIPEEANEFLATPPKNGKVEKFEDARAVVREIMTKAEEAKQQSAAAADEAAKVYDEVQAFKKETKEQIDQLNDDVANPAEPASVNVAAKDDVREEDKTPKIVK